MASVNDDTIVRDETSDMISSEKVDGTPVFDMDGERLGTIHHFMVGKRDGRVRFAVMNFGGFLGIGERYHPLPWDALTYDTDLGGYVVGLTKEKLKDAPSYGREEEPIFGAAYGQTVYGYYGYPWFA